MLKQKETKDQSPPSAKPNTLNKFNNTINSHKKSGPTLSKAKVNHLEDLLNRERLKEGKR